MKLLIALTLAAVLIVTGCATVGGESEAYRGLEFSPTGADEPLVIYETGYPECSTFEIGTVSAYAELKITVDEMEEESGETLARRIDAAERTAMVELRRRVRALGGHGVIDLVRSLSGSLGRRREEIGENLDLYDADRPGTLTFTRNTDKPRYHMSGTAIRFRDPDCTD